MKKVGVAILGLGVVGGGTYEILTKNRENYKKYYKVDVSVESVLELRKERALALGVEESKIASNIQEICSNPDVDIVVEVMGGVEPAKTFVLTALNAGKSVVTSNKELYCKHSHELEAVAKKISMALKASDGLDLVVCGGVAANSHLRRRLTEVAGKLGRQIFIPPISLCGDNGAMIAAAAAHEYEIGNLANSSLNASALDSIENAK